MAFKGRIDFGASDAANSARIADAISSGMSVTGLTETAGNFRDFSAMCLALTTFTSKRTAQAVLQKSLRHTPYRSGELYKSAYISSTESLGDMPRPTVIDENIEGTVAAYAANLAVSGSFTAKSGFFGARSFVKYAVGYTAEKAVMLHENPMGNVWRQDTNSPWKDLKTDHFLLHAYRAYEYRFSNAMRLGVDKITQAIAARAAAQTAVKSGAVGAPRLVKRVR